MKFPITEAQFRTWFKGKRDNFNIMIDRATTCPLARCLKANKVKEPVVGSAMWKNGPKGAQYDLPIWARRMVKGFDRNDKFLKDTK